MLVHALLAAVERLAAFPESGRPVPELDGNVFREVVHRTYRIVYLYDADEDRVEVLTVFHASRMFGGSAGT